IGTGVQYFAGLEVVSEELNSFALLAAGRRRAAVEDETLGIEGTTRDAMVRHGSGGGDFAFPPAGMDAQNPGALVVILVGPPLRRSAMRREVQETIVAPIDAAMDFARRVVALGQMEDFLDIDELAELLLVGVVLEDKGVAERGAVITERGVILTVHSETIAPRRPEFALVGLAGEEQEIDGR